MIRATQSLLRPIRIMIVAAFALLAVISGLSAAHADVITANHIAHGERMLPDGGWPSACDAAAEHCLPQPIDVDGDAYGLHHHHHPDGEFSGLPAAMDDAAGYISDGKSCVPDYAAVVKSASLPVADQPPKI